jgi:small subunit ribosomal protein S20
LREISLFDPVLFLYPFIMANTKSALKRVRQTATRTQHNRSVKTSIKTKMRKLRGLIDAKDAENARKAFEDLSSRLDKAAKTGVIHPNKADRKKSQYNKALVKLTAGS